MQLAAALTGLRVQGVPQDLVKRFFVDIASDDGLIGIHDLCAKRAAAHACRVCHAFSSRRAAIPIAEVAGLEEKQDFSSEEKEDFEAAQRRMFMQRLRQEGLNLRMFWERLLESCGGKATARFVQDRVGQLANMGSREVKGGRGVIRSFFCEDECELCFDDLYNALVCV